MSHTFLLIDANSIINRVYYGLAGRASMTASDGTPTGALLTFINIYLKHCQDLNPTVVCACFDLKAPTFRHLQYKEYKAARKEMPRDLVLQMPVLKELLDDMGIARIEMEGYEADDLIGSISRYAKELGWKTYILSGDKDDLQLVDDNTTVLLPCTKGGMSLTESYDVQAVVDKYRILPEQFIDLKAIMGDPSDNIPGVKGIGEKGAIDLIVEYGSLDRIYENLDKIKPAIAQKMIDSKEIAYLSKWLATIKRDIPVNEFIDELHNREMDKQKTYDILTRLGFRSIIQRLNLTRQENLDLQEPALQDVPKTDDISIIKKSRKVDLDEMKSILAKSDLYEFSQTETVATDDIYQYVAADFLRFSIKDERGFISFINVSADTAFIDCGDAEYYEIKREDFNGIFDYTAKEKIRIVSFNSKILLKDCNFDSHDFLLFDIFVAGYLLSQTEGKSSLERIAEMTLGHIPPFTDDNDLEVAQTNRQQSLFDDNCLDETAKNKSMTNKALYDLSFLHKIAKIQYDQLIERGLEFLALKVEMPLIGILARMECLGFMIDQNTLAQLNDDFSKRIKQLEEKIYEQADMVFNINSTKQLGDVLFKKLNLPTGRKTQSGFSTDADVLDKLFDKHPIIKEIKIYRQLSKLRSTFIDGLTKNIDSEDKRVHTTFNQTLTTTGRLSSSDPNLQNIPIKMEDGKEIRKAFVAPEGSVLIDADYSQIELRLLAVFSGDKEMTEAFKRNDDIHMNTAEEIFDMPRSMITPRMRSAAKTVNFSIVYGIGDYSLAQDLDISLKEAHTYIAEYYRKYPEVKPYLEKVVKEAYEKGYVETLFHRRRYIHELKSANRNIRMFGERVAMNTPVQGSAADIIKIAMILVSRKLHETDSKARLVLQVHDELILEAPEKEAEKVENILQEAMQEAVKLNVPLTVEVKTGKNWYNTK
ncbi:MAG: DNA polymerase I [Saccharofermentanales bacterium]